MTSRARSHQRVRAPRVLVVDDDADNRDMYVDFFGLAGFDAVGANDAPTAIELARTFRPALITMDLWLPGMSGSEATRILKTDPTTRDIIVFALTGHAESKYREEAAQAGCDLFIAKPCLPQELLEHVLRALDERAARAL
jgi:CheY-like chemotaxis protein